MREHVAPVPVVLPFGQVTVLLTQSTVNVSCP
jgi:hypothetical protein